MLKALQSLASWCFNKSGVPKTSNHSDTLLNLRTKNIKRCRSWSEAWGCMLFKYKCQVQMSSESWYFTVWLKNYVLFLIGVALSLFKNDILITYLSQLINYFCSMTLEHGKSRLYVQCDKLLLQAHAGHFKLAVLVAKNFAILCCYLKRYRKMWLIFITLYWEFDAPFLWTNIDSPLL